jgi:hypothetical protein
MQQERRRFHRTQISKVAKIVFGAHDYLSINCTVLNLSSGGACIHRGGPVYLRGGPVYLNRFSAPISGVSAGFRPPRGLAAC